MLKCRPWKLCAAVALAVSAPAQIALLPTRPILVASCAGPATLWSHFLPTEVGAYLTKHESGTMQSMLRRLSAELVERIAAEVEGAHDEDIAALDAALRAVRGRITLAVELQGAAQQPVLWLAIEDAEGTDAKAIEAALRGIQRRSGASMRALSGVGVPGVRAFRAVDQGFELSLPFAADARHHLLVLAPDVETALRQAVGTDDAGPRRYEPAAGAVAAPLAVAVDLAQAFEASGWSEEQRGAVGVDSLRRLQLTVGARGPQLECAAQIEFSKDPVGLVGALFGAAPGGGGEAAATHAHVAEGVALWHAFDADLHGLAVAFLDALEQDEPGARLWLKSALGIDLEGGLLAALGDAALVMRDGSNLFSRPTAFSFEVEDIELFDVEWGKACKDLAFDLEPDWSDEDPADAGFEIRKTRRLGGLVYGRAGSQFVLATGRDASQLVLDTLRRGAGRSAQPKMVDRVLAAGRHAPAGWHGAGRFDVDLLLGDVLGLVAFAPSEIPGGFIADLGGQLQPMLKRAGCDGATVLTGFAEGRWCLRALF